MERITITVAFCKLVDDLKKANPNSVVLASTFKEELQVYTGDEDITEMKLPREVTISQEYGGIPFLKAYGYLFSTRNISQEIAQYR